MAGNQERKREVRQQLIRSGFSYKAAWSDTTDLDTRLFDDESKTGIPWDVCASTAWRSILKSAMIPTCELLPKPTGHTETQHSSCSPQPCSLILGHFNQFILNTQTWGFRFQSSSIRNAWTIAAEAKETLALQPLLFAQQRLWFCLKTQ